MKKFIYITLFCVVGAYAAQDYSRQLLVGRSFMGKNLADARFNNANIQNTSFAFANLQDADFTSTPGNHTNIGNDVSFYCANLQGVKPDLNNKQMVSIFQTQAAATRANMTECQTVLQKLNAERVAQGLQPIAMPFTSDSLPGA